MEKGAKKEIQADGAEPRIYEVGFHIVPTIPEEEVALVVNTIRDAIETANGMVIAEEHPVLTELSYTMDHNVANKRSRFDSGYFGWLKFQADPERIAAVKDAMESNERVFRFLIIKTVRENTMAKKAPRGMKRAGAATSKEEGASEVVKERISDEELDKTIAELMVE